MIIMDRKCKFWRAAIFVEVCLLIVLCGNFCRGKVPYGTSRSALLTKSSSSFFSQLCKPSYYQLDTNWDYRMLPSYMSRYLVKKKIVKYNISILEKRYFWQERERSKVGGGISCLLKIEFPDANTLEFNLKARL